MQRSAVQETVSSSNFIVQSPLPTLVLYNNYISSSSTIKPAATPVIPIEEDDGPSTYTPDTDATTRNTLPSSNNQELLLELYIAIGVLVLFGIVIAVLLPISIWLCVKGQYLKTSKAVNYVTVCHCK